MATPEDFARECRDAAKGLRRVQRDLRRTLAGEVKDEVAIPLAAKIGAAASGPWATVLSAGVKARAAADPTIVVGGLRPKLSGGGGPRQVVFGVEFGGGKRQTAIPSTPARRGHRRRTTAQFSQRHDPFVFPTIAHNLPWVLDTFADLTMATLDKGVNDG